MTVIVPVHVYRRNTVPWIKAGEYPVIRRFDEERYLILINEDPLHKKRQITLVNRLDCSYG